MAGPRRPDPCHGVFETLLVHDGRPVELEAHLARLQASLEELFPDRTAPDPRTELEERVRDIGAAAVRLTAMPVGTRDLRVEIDLREALGAFFPLSGKKAPIHDAALHSLLIAGGLGAHKWADRSLLDGAQSRLPGDGLPLLVDEDTVLEASRANVFVVRDGALFTPPLDGRILPGITRMRVLEIAAGAAVETREAELRRADLLDADEVFLTGSVRGIEPAASLDGEALPGGGPVATALAAELRRAWLGAPVA